MPGLIRRAPGAPHRATFGSGAISQSRGSCPLPVGGRINSQKATCVASTIRAKHATSCPALCKFRPCLFHSSLRSLNDQVIERFGDRVLLKPCLGSAVRGFMYSVQCAILQLLFAQKHDLFYTDGLLRRLRRRRTLGLSIIFPPTTMPSEAFLRKRPQFVAQVVPTDNCFVCALTK